MPTDRRTLGRVLGWLYAGRALVAVAWAVTLTAAPASTADDLVIALLCGYPLVDLAATLIDLRAQPRGAAVTARLGNAAADAVAAVAILIAARSGSGGFWVAYGAWAVLTGGIQLVVAVHRRRVLPGQWLMIVSGAGSVVAGLGFASRTGPSGAGLGALTQYAIGGAIWYVITAIMLALQVGRGRTSPGSPAGAPPPPVDASATTQYRDAARPTASP